MTWNQQSKSYIVNTASIMQSHCTSPAALPCMLLTPSIIHLGPTATRLPLMDIMSHTAKPRISHNGKLINRALYDPEFLARLPSRRALYAVACVVLVATARARSRPRIKAAAMRRLFTRARDLNAIVATALRHGPDVYITQYAPRTTQTSLKRCLFPGLAALGACNIAKPHAHAQRKICMS